MLVRHKQGVHNPNVTKKQVNTQTDRKLGTDVEISIDFESLTSNGEILLGGESITNCFLCRNMVQTIKPETRDYRVVEAHLPFLKGKRRMVMQQF